MSAATVILWIEAKGIAFVLTLKKSGVIWTK